MNTPTPPHTAPLFASAAGAVIVEPKVGRGATAAMVTHVVLPLYNEAATLTRTLDTVLTFAHEHPQYQFLFVDDGSRDHTLSVLRERLGTDGQPGPDAQRRVGYVSYPDNRGKGHAIRTGIASLRGSADELVVFMDGDMAYGLDHLPEMYDALQRYDVVIGSRKESPEERRNTKKLRRLMGWSFNKLVNLGMGLNFADTQAGLKGFRVGAAREVFRRVTLRGFAFDVEALFIAKKLGYTIGEVPARVARAHRKKPSNVNLLAEPIKMAGDLFRVRLKWLAGRYK